MITLAEAEKITGLTSEDWKGQCHAISTQLAPHVGGVVRRGLFLGPTTSFVYQHSWIEMPDGTVLDPTVHAFTDRPPLWHGPADEYDIGGCRTAAPSGPPPSFYETERGEVDLVLPVAAEYVAGLLGLNGELWGGNGDGDGWALVSVEQVFWLGNLPVKEEERPGVLCRFYAAEVYSALIEAGHRASIPIDRLHWILGEDA